MPRRVEFTFRAKLGKPHKSEGNLLIYIPKDDAEIFALEPGDYCEVTLKVLTKPGVKE